MIVDSHCHLNLLNQEDYPQGVDAIINDARTAGVEHMLCVATTLENSPNTIAFAQQHRDISASVGVHPNELDGLQPSIENLSVLAQDACVVAIGETGLDYYRLEQAHYQTQQENFRTHIRTAKQLNKPLIIHTRQARADTIAIMREEDAGVAGGVLHCFTESLSMAKQALDLGFYISFSGIVTFKNAKELQEVAQALPIERILIETDTPYLAPTPYRGKPNQPAYVLEVAKKIAELKNLTLQEVAQQTTNNFYNLFANARRGGA